MAIDPVNSRDSAYKLKRQALEEERSEELDAISKKYRKQVNDTRESRGDQVRALREAEAEFIDDQTDRTKDKVATIKAGNTEKIRTFQEETSRLSQDASKKLQQKANDLSRFSKEFEQQREAISKGNSEALTDLMSKHDKVYRDKKEDLSAAEKSLYDRHKDQARELSDKTSTGVAELRKNHLQATEKEKSETQNTIRKLQEQRATAKNESASALEFERRVGSDQLENLRHDLSFQRDKVMEESDDHLLSLARNNRGKVQKTMLRGQREVDKMKDYYDIEKRDLLKSNEKAVTSEQNKAMQKIDHIQKEYAIQEQLAKLSNSNKNTKYDEQAHQLLVAKEKQSKALQMQYNGEAEVMRRMFAERNQKMFDDQNRKFSTQIKDQERFGQKKLNDALLNSSVAVDAYSSVAADPFYSLRKVDADVNDGEHEITVRIRVPKEEESRLRVTGKQNQLSISGSRSFENKARTDNGHNVSTNSFQSYAETIPMTGTPDLQKLVRSWDDGVLTVRIPKV